MPVKIHIKTFGCSLNFSDSELMAGLLQEEGFTLTETPEDAELLIINSCSVKNEAEAKLFREINHNPGKKFVITGCVPQAEPAYVTGKLKKYSILGVNNLNQIVHAVNETLAGHTYQNIKKNKDSRLNLPKIRKNPVVEIIPINEGCLDNCTYCKTKQARGHLRSYPLEEIKKQMEHALSEGCKEIWLTSQDTGCYGLDINTSLIALLNELLAVRGFFRIRLGMMNPNYALQYLEDLKELYQHPKMFKFLHIPVQSGNNRILRSMQRRYKIEAYKQVVEEMRKAVPELTISTDIIVAFPSETDDEFMDTYRLIEETKPDVLNISRYWIRTNTPAAYMPQIPGNISNQRAKNLSLLFKSILLQKNKSWIGWEGEVLIDEYGSHNSSIGRNDFYKQIVFENQTLPLGMRIKIKIADARQYDLRPALV